MIEVVQAFDRAPITRLDSDDIAALERKIEAARRLFADRNAWLKTHQRMEILKPRTKSADFPGIRLGISRFVLLEFAECLAGAQRNWL